MTTMQTAVAEFWAAPRDALFPQPVVEAVLGVSPAWCERGRWAGYGPKFIKLGRPIRYRKGDVLTWLEQYPVVSSTAQTSAGLPIERPRARVQPVERRKAQPIEPAAA